MTTETEAEMTYETQCACGASLESEDTQFFSVGDGSLVCESCLEAEGEVVA